MEKYIIYYLNTNDARRYLETIYRNNESVDEDIGEAIEFTNKNVALNVADYLNNRKSCSYEYKVLSVKTIVEEV